MLGSQARSRPQPRSRPPSSLGGGNDGRGLFNREMGPLQRQLHHGEFNILRHAPMLESNFVRVNRRGEAVDITKRPSIVTIAVACTNLMPGQSPDVLLVAHSVVRSRENLPPCENLLCQYPPPRTFELTSLTPLRLLMFSIHKKKKQQLRIKFPTGGTFYLQLCFYPGEQEDLFKLWVRVINLLRAPSELPLDPGGHEEAHRS